MKHHPIRGFFGFLLTIIIMALLWLNGVIFPLKTTILKGNDTNDILVNNGFYDVLRELILEELNDNYSSLGISRETFDKLFNKELLEEIGEEITVAIINGSEVDFSFLKDDFSTLVKTEVHDTINNAFDEIKANKYTVIDSNTLAENKTIKNFEADYGIDIKDMIMDALSEQYGVTSIDLRIVDINTVKELVTVSIEDSIYPELEKIISETIDESSADINTEINKALAENGVQEKLTRFELVINGLNWLMIALFATITMIAIIQLLMYGSCLYRAFRNFSISTIFPGLVIALTGFASSLFLPYVMDEISVEIDNAIITNFINDLLAPFFKKISLIGVVYLLAFLAFLILAVIFKSVYKKRTAVIPADRV